MGSQIRINAICPAIVDTQMTASIIDEFKKSNQAINTANDVAKYIVGLGVAPEMNGKAIYGTSKSCSASVLAVPSYNHLPVMNHPGMVQ
jgi:NAD(P)-dependent dehydrogenase (short-subunit alcohol dehydrogenase family)